MRRCFAHCRRCALVALVGTEEAGGGRYPVRRGCPSRGTQWHPHPMQPVLRSRASRHAIRSQVASLLVIELILMVDNEDVLYPSICKIAWEKTDLWPSYGACSVIYYCLGGFWAHRDLQERWRVCGHCHCHSLLGWQHLCAMRYPFPNSGRRD